MGAAMPQGREQQAKSGGRGLSGWGRGRRRDQGVALLAAVAVLAAISALTLGAARETRGFARIAGAALSTAQAEAAAEAGIARMALALAAASQGLGPTLGRQERARLASALGPERFSGARPFDDSAPIAIDGRPMAWVHQGAAGPVPVTLYGQAERGKLDLNVGDPAILRALFAAFGAPSPVIEAVLAARGIGVDGAGLSWRIAPRKIKGKITAVSELSRVDGMTPALFNALAPYLTVYGSRTPDPLLAPERLWRLIPMEDDARRRAAAARRGPPEPWRAAGSERVTIIAEAAQPDGARVIAAALVEIAPSAAAPIRIIRRRSQSGALADWAAPADPTAPAAPGRTAWLSFLGPAPATPREW